ncbi:metallophosphoesterase [Streptomyces sp. RK75]|uniref:metallophosphoesterase family protein n=1 Tax=Streptomyces sp. RK75 TaxID=2824895 RepID=UPI000C190F30|nr:metallophosphoesterase family protein [Streptomyces sp. RK75]MBQ0865884.1 metallophosphoesterase family protein [Streptomyces sp. RK75]
MVRTVAVLSDIHGMLGPLDQVLGEPAVVSADLILVTGDHVWGPEPAEVLDRLVSLGDRAVLLRGNADRELLQMSRGVDVGLGDDPVSVWGAEQLRPDHQQLLDVMPEQVTMKIDGFGPVLFCHATPRDDQEVVLVDSRIERWKEVFEDVPPSVSTVVCGHTHMPFTRLAAGRTVVNPGSVGLPYGRAGAHWALLHDGAITLRHTSLDREKLILETARRSALPGVEQWLDDYVRTPADDVEALMTFGPRDGRPRADTESEAAH